MTAQEIKEAEVSFRGTIFFLRWYFILYGNWKLRIVDVGRIRKKFIEIIEFHPWRAELSYEEKVKRGLIKKPDWWDEFYGDKK